MATIKPYQIIALAEEVGGMGKTLTEAKNQLLVERPYPCPKCEATGLLQVPQGLELPLINTECDLCDGYGKTYEEYVEKEIPGYLKQFVLASDPSIDGGGGSDD